MNYPLVTAFVAIFFAQAVKYPIAFFSNKGPDLDIITSTGGMPSSHSAAASSLIAALIFEYGFSSPYVAIATVFGVIIMFDSMGVRRQSGEQGIVIEALVKHLSKHNQGDVPLSGHIAQQNPNIDPKIIENYDDLIVTKYLGHKPTEVVVGVMTGGFVAIVMRFIYQSFFIH